MQFYGKTFIVSTAAYIAMGLLLVLVNLVWYVPISRILGEKIREEEQNAAQKSAVAATTFFETQKLYLEVIANALSDDLSDPRNYSLVSGLLREKSFNHVSLADFAGTELFVIDRSRTVFPGEYGTVRGTEEFTFAASGQSTFGRVRITDRFEPVLTVAVPVVSSKGKIIGVLGAEISAKSVAASIGAVTINGRGSAYVVDDTGVLIAHKDVSLVLKNTNLLDRLVVSETLKKSMSVYKNVSDEIYVYNNEEGVSVRGAGAYVESTRLAVIFEDPKKQAEQPLLLVQVLFGIIIGAGFVTIFILWKINANLARAKKTLEFERNQSRVHIETVIENLTSGLIEYDSDFTILRINKAAEEILGVARGSVIGKKIKPDDTTKIELESLARVSYPGIVPGVRKLPKDVSGYSTADVHEITIRQPLEKELQVVTAPIISPATGEKNGFIKVIRDITREKMISKSKSEFISIAAHQLRTPLSAIKWAIKLVIDGDVGPLNPEQLQFLVRGYNTNQIMISLVNELLNVARIEEGHFGYAFKEANMIEVINMIIDSSKLAAKERDIQVEFHNNTGDLKPFVFDAEKMALAIQNLLDNALKYTNPGGKIVMEVSVEGDYLKMSVTDNGVGVPKDQIPRLFSKFFRAENVIHMQTSGSGLGLFIVKNVIARHGGEIKVESEEGKGTTFTFSIPLKEELIPKDESLTYY